MLGIMELGRASVSALTRPYHTRSGESRMPRGYYTRKSEFERLMQFVSPEPMSGCWLWFGAANQGGYGVVRAHGKSYLAHRLSHELFKGPIPTGLHIDHLCRTPACVNPDHIEAVTCGENSRRGNVYEVNRVLQLLKTHCPQGHPYLGDNLVAVPCPRISTGINRICRTCRNKRAREWARRERQRNGSNHRS